MIKLEHYAYTEGRRGYNNGCALHQNPYYSLDENGCSFLYPHNEDAAENWDKGWKFQESKECQKAKFERQERMGYEC